MEHFLNRTVRLIEQPSGKLSSQYPIEVGQLFRVVGTLGCCLEVSVNTFERYSINHKSFELLDDGTKLLEWIKCYARAQGVDVTSINTPTIFRVPNNVAEVYRADLFVPNDNDMPEDKVTLYLYPEKQSMFVQGNKESNSIERLFRECGFEGPNLEH